MFEQKTLARAVSADVEARHQKFRNGASGKP
jgi:hypothetical protein